METSTFTFVFQTALELKELFRKIETQKWTAYAYSMEVIVQIGHLADIFLRQEYKYNPFSEKENQMKIGDEISDVLLNLIFLYIELFGTKFPPTLHYETSQFSKEELFIELTLSSVKIIPLTSVYIVSEVDKEKIRENLIYAIQLTISLLDNCNCSVISNFLRIKNESQLFIEKHTQQQ
jgi:hypothetical protein